MAESRSEEKVRNNLGVISLGKSASSSKRYRDAQLNIYDKYAEGKQYDHLQAWDVANCSDDYVEVRKRKPRVIVDFPKRASNTFASKLLSSQVFPEIKFDTNEVEVTEKSLIDSVFLEVILELLNLKKIGPELGRKMAISGSVFLRYRMLDTGYPVLEVYNANHCYPVLDQQGGLESIRVQYVFKDEDDRDRHGRAKEKWYRLELTKTVDTLFDSPEYKDNSEPEFQIEEQIEHGLGFVQGEWLRRTEDITEIDGDSLLSGNVLSIVDDINYSYSQSSQAIGYGQEPQPILKGMTEDEMETLVKSSQKAWNLGRDGDASFLEAGLGGVERAAEMRDGLKQAFQDITRIILHDPEKMQGQAQSGKALEILHQPMVDLINEVRPIIEPRLESLIIKVIITLLRQSQVGNEIPFNIPPGYQPDTFDLKFSWPPIFKQTMQDLKEKAQLGLSLASGNILSRESILKWLAKDFDVEDIQAEIEKVNTQQQFNTFGF